MHRVNDSGAIMSAEVVFEVKTHSVSMTTYSKGNRAVAPPDRPKIIREYKTKLKNADKKCTRSCLTQLDLLKCHLADSTKEESFH